MMWLYIAFCSWVVCANHCTPHPLLATGSGMGGTQGGNVAGAGSSRLLRRQAGTATRTTQTAMVRCRWRRDFRGLNAVRKVISPKGVKLVKIRSFWGDTLLIELCYNSIKEANERLTGDDKDGYKI